MLERFSRRRTAEIEQSVWYKAQVAIQKQEDEQRAQFRKAVILAQEYMAKNEAAKSTEVVVRPEAVAVASLGFAPSISSDRSEEKTVKARRSRGERLKKGWRQFRTKLAPFELAGSLTALTLTPAAHLATVPISAETGVQPVGSDTTTPSATRQARVDGPSVTGVGTAEIDDAVRGIVSRERTNTPVVSAVPAEPTVQTPAETTTQAQPEQNSSPSTESLDNASRGVDAATEQAQEAAKTLGITENDQISKNVGDQLTAARKAIASADEKEHIHDENCPEDHNYHPSTTVPKTSTTISTTSTTVYTPTTHTYPPKTTTTSTTKYEKPSTTTSTTVDTPDITVVIPSTTSTTLPASTTSSTSTTSTTPTTAFVPSTTSTTEAPTTTKPATRPQRVEIQVIKQPEKNVEEKVQEVMVPKRELPRTGIDSAALVFPALGLVFAGDALNVLARKREEKDLVNA